MNFALGFKPLEAGDSGPGGLPGGRAMDHLEKQLICPICLEMFSKPVVILPCQHNLCRKCANDIFQAANPLWHSRGSSSMVSTGGRFRCPSCRHEVVMDRHGVYGLQRNLLVENIIDIYKQQESSRPVSVKLEQQHQQQLMCNEHEEEKINIYCVSCQTPTCSMCKIELGDGIAILVAGNDRIQALISQMEAICQTIEENGRRQKEHLASSFDGLVAILEERKKELVGLIAKQQDDKLKYVRSLIRNHGGHLETAVKLVESAIQSMEEPHMALFLQSATVILEKITATSKAATMERLEPGYESMTHFTINTDDVADMLRNIDSCSGMGDEGEEDTEEGDDLSSLAGGELDYCHRY